MTKAEIMKLYRRKEGEMPSSMIVRLQCIIENLANERDAIAKSNEKLVEALSSNISWLHRMSGLQWENPDYAPNFKAHCENAKQALADHRERMEKLK